MDVELVAHRFYESFANKDYQVMNSLYIDGRDDVFSDPIFENLSTEQVRAMWEMILSSSGNDFELKYQIKSITENSATVDWQASYVLSSTGRQIVNSVTSDLKIENGLITEQKDNFDLCDWARQGFRFFKAHIICLLPDATIRKEARKNLLRFMKR